MWNKIVVAFSLIDGRGDGVWDRSQDLVELCIKRSKNWPLFIAIQSSASGEVGDVGTAVHILAVLRAEAERWHSLELACHITIIEEILWAGDIPDRFPRPHSLRMHSNSCKDVPIIPGLPVPYAP